MNDKTSKCMEVVKNIIKSPVRLLSLYQIESLSHLIEVSVSLKKHKDLLLEKTAKILLLKNEIASLRKENERLNYELEALGCKCPTTRELQLKAEIARLQKERNHYVTEYEKYFYKADRLQKIVDNIRGMIRGKE